MLNFREPVMLKKCSQRLILADMSSFYFMSAIFSLSLVRLCKRISLLLFIPIFNLWACLWWQWRRHKEAIKMGRLPYFKHFYISHSSHRHHPCSNFPLQSHRTISFPPPSHVQHSQPAVKLIASTSFQGHTITPTSQSLLHEYIEERFPATLFHDWIPKDKREKRKKWGNGKGGEGAETGCF